MNENIRVNQSLLKNGMRNSTALTRSETEKQKIETSITQAANNRNNVQAYLNFLMNRSLDHRYHAGHRQFRYRRANPQLAL